jgi:hypothetical protein
MEGDRNWKGRVSLSALEISTSLEQDSNDCGCGRDSFGDTDDAEESLMAESDVATPTFTLPSVIAMFGQLHKDTTISMGNLTRQILEK